MIRYLTLFTISLAGCFVLQSVALRAAGGKTRKSESNYFSSLARIQTEAAKASVVMLLGSSLTGRLPERTGVANLGCDGGSAVVTLRALDEGILPRADAVVIEANTLAYELQSRGKEIAAAMRSDWFKIGAKFPNLGATARPTAFVYSWLDGKRNAADVPDGEPLDGREFSVMKGEVPVLEETEDRLVTELELLTDRLVQRGTEVFVVMLPAGGREKAEDLRIAEAFAVRSGLPGLDLNDAPVTYTDGRHLSPASASVVADAILEAVRNSRADGGSRSRR